MKSPAFERVPPPRFRTLSAESSSKKSRRSLPRMRENSVESKTTDSRKSSNPLAVLLPSTNSTVPKKSRGSLVGLLPRMCTNSMGFKAADSKKSSRSLASLLPRMRTASTKSPDPLAVPLLRMRTNWTDSKTVAPEPTKGLRPPTLTLPRMRAASDSQLPRRNGYAPFIRQLINIELNHLPFSIFFCPLDPKPTRAPTRSR